MSQSENKELVSKAKELFQDKGYEVKTSHLYDIFAKLAGYKNWHVASAQNASLAKAIVSAVEESPKVNSENYFSKLKGHFVNEEGASVEINLFNPYLPAWNFTVSGQTGSGKSVLVNKLLSKELKAFSSNKPIISIFELGGERSSYAKLVELFGGREFKMTRSKRPSIHFFEIDPEVAQPSKSKIKEVTNFILTKYPTSLNFTAVQEQVIDFYEQVYLKTAWFSLEVKKGIFKDIFDFEFGSEYQEAFSLKVGECLPSKEQLNGILRAFSIILSSSNTDNTYQEYDKDEIVSLITDVYSVVGEKEKRFPLLSDLHQLLSEGNGQGPWIDKSTPAGRRLLGKIFRWTQGGEYPFFDKPTTIDLSEDLNLINLGALSSHPELQAMYYLLINRLINIKMMKASSRKKIVVRDEILSIARFSQVSESVFQDLFESRKNRIATLTVSQTLLDYEACGPALSGGKSYLFQSHIIGETSSYAVRRNVESLFQIPSDCFSGLGFFSKEEAGEKNYGMTFRVYSKTPEACLGLIKNCLNDFEEVLYSSREEDNVILDFYMKEKKKFNNLEEALDFIARKQHGDDLELREYLISKGLSNSVKRMVR